MIIRKFLTYIGLATALVGCAAPSVIKEVADRKVEDLKASATSKEIQFKRIVLKLKRGEQIGSLLVGFLCVPQGQITWKGGRLNIDSDEFTEAFRDELEKFNFKTVGDTNALFEDPTTWKSEILVAGLVKELKANVCYPKSGIGNFSDAKGEAFMKVEWQIYSKLDRSVVHTVSTEGSYKGTEAVSGGDTSVVLNAFAQATRNLLADSRFREIVSKGGQTVQGTEVKSSSTIVIEASRASYISASPEDWTNAVVTIIAGDGHGSGFVIADDLIMTNQHVVGSANSVLIRLKGGLQIPGQVIASNSGRDVALVKVNSVFPKRFKVAKSMLPVGSEVFVIGTPISEKFETTVSKGIVSAIREEQGKRLIQSDVNVRPGSSGGPMLNSAGEVLGITVSGIVVGSASQGINFFIPISDALSSLGVK